MCIRGSYVSWKTDACCRTLCAIEGEGMCRERQVCDVKGKFAQ